METTPYHIHDGVDSPKVKQTKVRGVYADSEVVHLTGDETIAGVKTLTSIPVLPASNPTTDNQAVRKAYLDGLIPGFEVVASDTVRDSASTNRIYSETVATKYKDITFNEVDGTIRVVFTINRNSGANSTYARIYVNGTAVGTEQSTTAASEVTFTEDIAVATGDEVQLYCWNGSGTDGYLSDFSLRYDKVFATIAGTVNSD